MPDRKQRKDRAPASFRVWTLLLCIIALNVIIGCEKQVEADPVVFANGEELHGAWDDAADGIAVFKGIPFAAPPVADLRWRAPAAHKPRKGAQSATEFAPACMQTAYMTDWYADVAEAFGANREAAAKPVGISEDCLYLNVWAPMPLSDTPLPVMVWVHGGSNKGGWSYEPNYLGGSLAAKGVVVVTVAYRLGAFGFFSHPVLDDGAGDPVANFGILDIAKAVEWITEHVESFGGDPQSITLMGESAGAGNISDMVTMGLVTDFDIDRMILQSSASDLGSRRTLADEQATGQRLINSLGLEGTITAGTLRGIPAQALLAAYMESLQGHYFDAVVDGRTLHHDPVDGLRQRVGKRLNLLIGTNADEWYMYIDEDAGQDDLDRTIQRLAPGHAPAILAELGQPEDFRHAIDRIQAAENMHCPSRYLAAMVTGLGGQGRVYHFSRQRPGSGGEALGAYHGAEIPYVFDTHDEWLPVDEPDAHLTETIMDYWVQFARTGDPNIASRPPWPAFARQRPLVMELGDNIGAREPTDTWLCEILGPEQKQRKRGL